MIVIPDLVKGSIRRLDFDPRRKAADLGEGPRQLTPTQKRDRFKSLLAATGDPERARTVLERFIGGNDLVSVNYLLRGMMASRSVCRIRLMTEDGKLEGYGTGFLIAPEVMMTNNHVLTSEQDAASAICDFNYELDAQNRDCQTDTFKLEPARLFHTSKELDFSIVAISPISTDNETPLTGYLHLAMRAEPGKATPGEYLSIIQHPNGERKQVCVRENKMLKYDDNVVWYQTDTVPGSSGSPVFNNLWQVVALHHSGVPETDDQGNWLTADGGKWDPSMDETQVAWKANEGIRVSRIIGFLQEALPSHPLVQSILNATDPLPPTESDHAGSNSSAGGASTSQVRDGELLVTVPIRVSIRVGDLAAKPSAKQVSQAQAPGVAVAQALTNVAAGKTTPAVTTPTIEIPAVESVSIDQSKILSRPGYDPDFLGTGDLSVPLPVVRDAALSKQILKWTYKGSSGTELKYYNYSVVMNKARKLAFFAAVNIDGTQLQDVGKREGDQWYEDPRAKGFQVNNSEFYGIQLREADRTVNPFDRGHLVRRLDATWGTSEALAKRNGDDTFHFTNCSPQFWKFNEGTGKGASRLWAGIEDYALAKAVNGSRLCVLNGPVFDSPQSLKNDGDGQPYPNPTGRHMPDRKLLGIGIPRWFWKAVVMRGSGNKLSVGAYVLSQESFVKDIGSLEELRLRPLTELQANAFAISIINLEKLTGLDFGPLRKFDSFAHESMIGPRPLQTEADLGFDTNGSARRSAVALAVSMAGSVPRGNGEKAKPRR